MINLNVNWLLLFSGLGVIVLTLIIILVEEAVAMGEPYSAAKKDIAGAQNIFKAYSFSYRHIFHRLRNFI